VQEEPSKLHEQARQGLQGVFPRHLGSQVQIVFKVEPQDLEGRPQPDMHLGWLKFHGFAQHAISESFWKSI
jgi:hypothetical protein